VIATCRADTEISEIVSQCGLVVAPQDSTALAGAVGRLADDKPMRLELGRRARALAESNFDREAVLSALFGSLKQRLVGEIANDVAA